MKRKILTFTVVYGVSIGCLAWVFHGLDLRQLKHDIATVRWPYLVMGALFNVSIYFANAWRWKILLWPVAPARFRRSLQAIYVGLFLNDVLPLRPGEIVRCGLISRWTPDLRFTVAISSAMIERLFEFAWLVAGFFAVVAFTPVPKALVYSCAIVSGALFGASLLLVVLARRSGPGQEHRQGSSFVRGWHQFINGLRLMANTRTMLLVTAMSGLALLLNVLATWELMKACGILLPLVVAAAVLIITRVGTAIPATPGSVGAYQFFSVLGLGLFGVSKTAAAAFTVIAFGAFTFPLLLGGAVAFVFAGTDFTEIVSLTRRPSSQGLATEQNEGSSNRPALPI